MSRAIAVSLKKGGVGKTTTAVNLAAGLHQAGKKVLLVDIDPQASATISSGIDITTLNKSITDLFEDIHLKTEDVIIKTSFGMDILPSHPNLSQIESGMSAASIGELKKILKTIEHLYDFIIIDTPPSESHLSVSALVYVDEVLIPVETHFLSLQGLQQLFEMIDSVKRGLNPELKIAGLLPTKVHNRTNMSIKVLETLNKQFSDMVFPFTIDFTVRHPEASMAGTPLIILEPAHPGAIAYQNLVNNILNK